MKIRRKWVIRDFSRWVEVVLEEGMVGCLAWSWSVLFERWGCGWRLGTLDFAGGAKVST
jgi:hypothetical protein